VRHRRHDPDPARAYARVQAMNDAQLHRGPDNSVVVRVGPATIGNTRLAIQDPTPEGNQPFVSRDGRYVCVFNGEIYNYPELIDRHGLEVSSHCDGAVIPELWSRLGPGCLGLMRGMYAVAVVDSQAETLTLARDPLGIKPLCWRRLADGTVLFASEVRSLARLGERPQLSPEAVARYLHLGSLAPDQTAFREVQAVGPNELVTFDRGGQQVATGTISAAPGPAGDLASAFRDSVRLHLRSDVPTALLLSSGVDSAAIAAAAAEGGKELTCITVAGLGQADETEGAGQTARHYGHDLTVVPAVLDEHVVNRFFAQMQRPTIDGLNTFLVSHAVRDAGCKVALSGAGGDEALGGYPHYRILKLLPFMDVLDRIPQHWTAKALTLAARVSARARSDKAVRLLSAGGPRTGWGISPLQREVFAPATVRALTGIEPSELPGSAPPAQHDGGRDFASLVQAEVALYLQSVLLPDADAFSMACSVELRVPFVDVGIFAAAAAAAAEPGKAGRNRGGGLDKAQFCDRLADPYLASLARRPKRGFSVPMASWMRQGGPLAATIEAATRADAPIWQWVDRGVGLGLLSDPERPRWAEAWSLAAMNAWVQSVSEDPVLTLDGTAA
jgi:asparagine synthase (glutamine-hydrolysing)